MGDISWDYYMCTGIDPTGGALGPDFDVETGAYLDDEEALEDDSVYFDEEPNGLSSLENYLDRMLVALDNIERRK